MDRFWILVALMVPLVQGCAKATQGKDVIVGNRDIGTPTLGGFDMAMQPSSPPDAGMDPLIPVVDGASTPVSMADAGAPAVMGDPACAALADCLSACNTGPCAQMCRESAPVESSQRYDAIFACGRAQGCGEVGGGFIEECMEERCAAELEVCYGPPPDPPPPGMGVLTCSEVAMCLGECPSGDIACRDDCYRAATPEAHGQYTAAIDCLDTCEPEDYACRVTDCRDELTACYGPQAPPPVGQSSCSETNQCLAECMEGDRACVDACYGAASADGFNSLLGLRTCINSSGCPEPAETACIQRVCPEQWESCFGSVPMGVASCAEFNLCVNACGADDEACFDECVEMASVEGYNAWFTAVNCIQEAGCANNDQACVDANCGAEVEACVGPQVRPMGNANCMQFNGCLSMCDGDRPCIDQCIGLASPEGYRLLVAILDCFQANMCMGNDPNCQRLCMNEITACENHR